MRADTSAFPVVRAVALILAHVPSLQLRCHAAGVGQILARVNPRDAADVQAGQQVRLGFAPEEAICVPER